MRFWLCLLANCATGASLKCNHFWGLLSTLWPHMSACINKTSCQTLRATTELELKLIINIELSSDELRQRKKQMQSITNCTLTHTKKGRD